MALELPIHERWSSKGRVNFAAASKCRYVELLRYPDRPPLKRDGELDDTTLPVWFNKVSRAIKQKVIILYLLTSLRILPYPPFRQAPIKRLWVVCGYCKSMAQKYTLSISHITVRIGTCDFSPKDFHISLSFQKESFHAMEERLALSTEFLKCLTRNTTQAFMVLKQRRGKKSLICNSPIKSTGNF
jgi:hypothetical protein